MIHAFQGLNVNLLLCAGLTVFLLTLSSRDSRVRCAFVVLAVFFNISYVSWRIHATLVPLYPSIESVWQWAFFTAELSSVILLSWHLIILISRPTDLEQSRRGVRPLPELVPSVDVMIPTVNEPMEMLRETIRAARKINYASVRVWVLDDGNRPELRAWCAKEKVDYLSRTERAGFKAGNLNHALNHANGDYILCIDADFQVLPEILNQTIGYFEDDRIAIVQTPQHFSNPDAIQYNLGGGDAWPENQCVFTDVMQPCRDKWDNAFCYGSNFIIRRIHLNELGGFPEKSICEDLFLTYQLKQKGRITRYHNEVLAYGQAAITLNEFIKQRVRWCYGTIQCLFLKGGPIFNTKLPLIDRLFFFDPALFYLTSIWSFFVLITPAIYWWSGIAPFQSDQGHLLMMLLPRMWISMFGLYWLTDRKVVPVVSEIGRHVSIFHLVKTTLHSLVSPFRGTFHVTLKQNQRDSTRINWALFGPHLALTLVTISGIAYSLRQGMSSHLIWDENLGLILALTTYALWMNLFTLLACVEPPLKATESWEKHPTRQGSIVRSIGALFRKVVQ